MNINCNEVHHKTLNSNNFKIKQDIVNSLHLDLHDFPISVTNLLLEFWLQLKKRFKLIYWILKLMHWPFYIMYRLLHLNEMSDDAGHFMWVCESNSEAKVFLKSNRLDIASGLEQPHFIHIFVLEILIYFI